MKAQELKLHTKKLQSKNRVMLFNLRRHLTGNCEQILLPLWLTAYLTT